MPETVYTTLKGRNRRVFHTDRDCQYLERAESRIQERDPEELDERWTECEVCGERADRAKPDFSYQKALRAAGEGGSA